MLDTVKVRFPVKLLPSELIEWRRKDTGTESGYTDHLWVKEFRAPGTGAVVYGRYRPVDYHKRPCLSLEFSLPKVVYGSNLHMVLDIDSAIDEANQIFHDIPLLPWVDLRQGMLQRLDLCYNHEVGPSHVAPYFNALSRLEYPHRETVHHLHGGVYYRSRYITTKFYNKERECGYSNAIGVLRQETSITGGSFIAASLGSDYSPMLCDIRLEMAASVLRGDLERLRLDNVIVAGIWPGAEILIEHYGRKDGLMLIGFADLLRRYPRMEIPSLLGAGRSTMYRILGKFKECGLAPVLLDEEITLPPLRIDLGAAHEIGGGSRNEWGNITGVDDVTKLTMP